jgi:hypothetical protein
MLLYPLAYLKYLNAEKATGQFSVSTISNCEKNINCIACIASIPIHLGAKSETKKMNVSRIIKIRFIIDKVLYCCVNWLTVSGNYDPLQSKFTVQS